MRRKVFILHKRSAKVRIDLFLLVEHNVRGQSGILGLSSGRMDFSLRTRTARFTNAERPGLF
jgi:hypothetical protein